MTFVILCCTTCLKHPKMVGWVNASMLQICAPAKPWSARSLMPTARITTPKVKPYNWDTMPTDALFLTFSRPTGFYRPTISFHSSYVEEIASASDNSDNSAPVSPFLPALFLKELAPRTVTPKEGKGTGLKAWSSFLFSHVPFCIKYNQLCRIFVILPWVEKTLHLKSGFWALFLRTFKQIRAIFFIFFAKIYTPQRSTEKK